jgi:hypothetical protein
MTTVRLHALPAGLSVRTSGPETGDIAVVFDGRAFPASKWNDFVVVILTAWLSALRRVCQTAHTTERVHFMEGPFAVDLTGLGDGTVRVRAIERPSRQRAMVDVSSRDLIADADAAASAILGECGRMSHRSADTDHLERALAELRSLQG